MFTVKFWKAAAERATKSVAQAVVLYFGADQVFDAWHANWGAAGWHRPRRRRAVGAVVTAVGKGRRLQLTLTREGVAMRDWFELAVSNLGRRVGNLNDRLYRRASSRWDRSSWRFVDRIAGCLYTYGER